MSDAKHGAAGTRLNLTVESASPNNLYERVIEKTQEYLRVGVREVWLASLGQKTVTAPTSHVRVWVYAESHVIESSDVLPGFRLKVVDLYHEPKRETGSSVGSEPGV